MSSTIELTKRLVAKPSLTPDDQGCQLLIAERLRKLNFKIEHLRFGNVDNLWAQFGKQGPLFVFAGHTDVVPTGPIEKWICPPFQPTSKNGYLYGRGVADMKGSIAAMITAVERFIEMHPNFSGSIGFLITSDEEGPATDGTVKVLEWLQEQQIKMDYCLVGEPSSEEKLGDVIKVGRRGSMSGHLKIFGEQKHIAYANHEDNPIHSALDPLLALTKSIWETEEILAPFPKTSFHISNIHAGTHAWNIVPGHLECFFNFRFSPLVTPEFLQNKVKSLLDNFNYRYELEFHVSGLPFLTPEGRLRNVCSEAIHEKLGIIPTPSASGGTSDARFIAQSGCEVVEFGPSRFSIHAINECIKESDLDQLSIVYEEILNKIFKIN